MDLKYGPSEATPANSQAPLSSAAK
jgi:hypothetical protein